MGGAAQAQQLPCDSHATIAEKLAQQFREVIVSSGLTSSGNLFEIFASPGGETWTAVLAYPNGMACLVAEGEFWQVMAPKVPTDGT